MTTQKERVLDRYPIEDELNVKRFNILNDCRAAFYEGSHAGAAEVLVRVILQLEERIKTLESKT